MPKRRTRGIVVGMDLRFVLVEPAVPENVGSAARALKTMGFHELALVNTRVHGEAKACWTAHGSKDILEGAKEFATLGEAIQDIDFVVATTARRRTLHHDYYDPPALRELLQKKEGIVRKTALLFGREESGLTNAELGSAHCLSSVPLAAQYPSLNLAQAVMVYAYELSPLRSTESSSTGTSPFLVYSALRRRVEILLYRIGFSPDNLVGKRLEERLALLSGSDLRLVHSLCARLEKYLSNVEEHTGGYPE